MVRMDKPCACPRLQGPHGREEYSHLGVCSVLLHGCLYRIELLGKMAWCAGQISFAADVEPAGAAKSNVVEVVMASPTGASTATSTSAD